MPRLIPIPKCYRNLLEHYVYDKRVLKHCLATQSKAVYIAEKISQYIEVDIALVSIGAFLHDIGRAQTHDVTHGMIGGLILHKEECSGEVIRVVERHVLGGFTALEAKLVGLPHRSFLPETWEEKIVCVADKLGLYHWGGINSLSQWIPKVRNRVSKLLNRYGEDEPYKASMQRVLQYTRSLIRKIMESSD